MKLILKSNQTELISESKVLNFPRRNPNFTTSNLAMQTEVGKNKRFEIHEVNSKRYLRYPKILNPLHKYKKKKKLWIERSNLRAF